MLILAPCSAYIPHGCRIGPGMKLSWPSTFSIQGGLSSGLGPWTGMFKLFAGLDLGIGLVFGHRGIGTEGYLRTDECRLRLVKIVSSPAVIISAGLSSRCWKLFQTSPWKFEKQHVLVTICSRERCVYSASGNFVSYFSHLSLQPPRLRQ
jgi:hypothetical protein